MATQPTRGVYGAAAVAKALQGVDFPQNKQALINQVGSREVQVTHEKLVKMSDILTKIPDKQYNTAADLLAVALTRLPLPQGGVYGAAAVARALQGVDFPKSKQDLINEVGSREVHVTHEKLVKMSDILIKMPDKQYSNAADLMVEAQDYIEEA